MAQLKVDVLADGMHPSEALIGIQTSDRGVVESFADRRSINDGMIDIGFPVGHSTNLGYLVELPQETAHGSWRVWVPEEQVVGA